MPWDTKSARTVFTCKYSGSHNNVEYEDSRSKLIKPDPTFISYINLLAVFG